MKIVSQTIVYKIEAEGQHYIYECEHLNGKVNEWIKHDGGYIYNSFNPKCNTPQGEAAYQAIQQHLPPVAPTWYTEQEINKYLIRKGYSEHIAGELSPMWARDLQGAFNKGFAMALGNPGDYVHLLKTAAIHIDTLTTAGKALATRKILNHLNIAIEIIQLARKDKPGALDLLRTINDYLSSNAKNYIGSGSKVHEDIKSILKPYKQ